MLNQIKAVIFDLDGTLMDSMWMWRDIDIEYLARYGFALPERLQKEIEGMGFTETAHYFKERFSIPEPIEDIKKEWNRMAYEKYAKEVPAKKGAHKFLEYLKQQQIPAAIASSNSRELIHASLQHNELTEYFTCITISCDVPKGKPAPDIYLRTAERLGVLPEECLVFEDVPMGIRAGLAAGMRVCAVEDQQALDQKEEICHLAHYYIRTFDEVLDRNYELLREV